MRTILSAVSLAAIFASPASSQCQVGQLDIPPAALGAAAVDVTEDWAFAGSPGAGLGPQFVHVYRRVAGQWALTQTLDEPASSSGLFGGQVAASGDWLWVGSPSSSGATPIYAYQRTGSTWALAQEVVLAGATEANIGSILAIDGNSAVVGRPTQGKVRAFELVAGAWTPMPGVQKFGAGLGTGFGRSVDVNGDWVVVGAPTDTHPDGTNFAGSAYVFHRGATSWEPSAQLMPADPQFNGQVAGSVAVANNRVALGSLTDLRQVHAFGWDGSAWFEETMVMPQFVTPDFSATEDFGWSLDMDGDRLVVGAPHAIGIGFQRGANWLFEHNGTAWMQRARFFHDFGQAFEEFGLDVALDGDTVVTLSQSLNQSVTVHEIGFGSNFAYCAAAPNSVGPTGAQITWIGNLSVATNELTLFVWNTPATPKVFLAGDAQAQLPFGNGQLCVSNFGRISPPTILPALGLNLAQFPSASGLGPVLPGTNLFFQCWYRDTAAGAAGFNLTDGLSLQFCP